MYLKTLGMHVHLAATKKSYLGNDKHIEANAQAVKPRSRRVRRRYCDVYTQVRNTLTYIR